MRPKTITWDKGVDNKHEEETNEHDKKEMSCNDKEWTGESKVPSANQPQGSQRECPARAAKPETATLQKGVPVPPPEQEVAGAGVNSMKQEAKEPAQGPLNEEETTFDDRSKNMSRWSLTRVKALKAPGASEDTGALLEGAETDEEKTSILVEAITRELFRSKKRSDHLLKTKGPIGYLSRDALYGQAGKNLLGQALTTARDKFKKHSKEDNPATGTKRLPQEETCEQE